MKLIIIAPTGKMGKLISKIAAQSENFEIIAGIGPKGREYIGKDIGVVSMLGYEVGALVVDDLESVIEQCDVIIDFSTLELSMKVMDLAVKYHKALVCGTTGFGQNEKDRIQEASKKIPLLYAANTSRVVNLMSKLLELTTEVLGADADIEIIEMHDKNKKDAPSGTAREMGEVIAEAMGKDIDDLAVYGREGKGGREPGTIAYHSLRAGDISSSHTVVFGCMGERLEITHHAYNWECFARGACECALFLQDKPEGFYTVKDALGLS